MSSFLDDEVSVIHREWLGLCLIAIFVFNIKSSHRLPCFVFPILKNVPNGALLAKNLGGKSSSDGSTREAMNRHEFRDLNPSQDTNPACSQLFGIDQKSKAGCRKICLKIRI